MDNLCKEHGCQQQHTDFLCHFFSGRAAIAQASFQERFNQKSKTSWQALFPSTPTPNNKKQKGS